MTLLAEAQALVDSLPVSRKSIRLEGDLGEAAYTHADTENCLGRGDMSARRFTATRRQGGVYIRRDR